MPNIYLNGNTAKKLFFNGNAVKKLFLNGNQIWQDAVLPVGIIIGYTGLTAPSGWSLFSSANDKLIVGAGNSYEVNTTGGSNSVSKTLSISESGAHSATTGAVIGSSSSGYGGLSSAGGHTHTITVIGTLNPYRHQIGLIKALVETNMPIGGIIFSASDISTDIDATNVNTTSAFLSSSASDRTLVGSDGNITLSGASTLSGGHNHGTIGTSGTINQGYAVDFATTHNHTASISISPQIKAKYLTAWSNALSEVSICPNVIGMWESSIAPDGWAICDGTNGTPDLRNYFIRLGDVSTVGSIYNSGENTTIPAVNMTSTGSHSHTFGTKKGKNAIDAGHTVSTGSHSHTTVADTVSIVPTYYALTFIMKL